MFDGLWMLLFQMTKSNWPVTASCWGVLNIAMHMGMGVWWQKLSLRDTSMNKWMMRQYACRKPPKQLHISLGFMCKNNAICMVFACLSDNIFHVLKHEPCEQASSESRSLWLAVLCKGMRPPCTRNHGEQNRPPNAEKRAAPWFASWPVFIIII